MASIAVALAAAAPLAAQAIATAVEVTGRAEMSVGGQRFIIRSGARIDDGTRVSTSDDGTVQITFDDGTNMVVGRNSSLEITEVLMTSSNRASRFAVNAVSGGFRFITGNSDKDAYEITTPTATMGVRGTSFDLAVARRETTLALFDGSVRMCRSSRRCAIVSGSCAVARTGGSRGIEGLTGRAAADALSGAFSFVAQQSQLRSGFRAATGGCGRYFQIRSDRNPVPAPPAAAPPPAAPPPPAPEPPRREPPPPDRPAPQPSGNFPGNSGSVGPSEGRGGGASSGQDGSGRGSGQGAENRNGGGGNTDAGGGGGTGRGGNADAGNGNRGGGSGNGRGNGNGRGGSSG
ncbi:FecR domain-containing protein [Roseibacterium sp. SDUM158017]|nr:FecR domain-containing protein [Roseibacterium sp. SDUM158017]